MNKEQFLNAKIEIAKRVVPHLTNPEKNGSVKISIADCALLMSKDENHIMTSPQLNKIERIALTKLGDGLRSYGVMCSADCIPRKSL
jgi:hypothetical protein